MSKNDQDEAARKAAESEAARRKAADEAAEATRQTAATAAAEGTVAARESSAETLRQQAEMRPEPSQEEADAIRAGRSVESTGALPYKTRQARAG